MYYSLNLIGLEKAATTLEPLSKDDLANAQNVQQTNLGNKININNGEISKATPTTEEYGNINLYKYLQGVAAHYDTDQGMRDYLTRINEYSQGKTDVLPLSYGHFKELGIPILPDGHHLPEDYYQYVPALVNKLNEEKPGYLNPNDLQQVDKWNAEGTLDQHKEDLNRMEDQMNYRLFNSAGVRPVAGTTAGDLSFYNKLGALGYEPAYMPAGVAGLAALAGGVADGSVGTGIGTGLGGLLGGAAGMYLSDALGYNLGNDMQMGGNIGALIGSGLGYLGTRSKKKKKKR